MAPPAHLHREPRHGDRVARTPVACAGHADALGPVLLDDVDRALRRDLRLRVERQPRPEPVLQDHLDRVLFGVIDHHALRLDLAVAAQDVDGDVRPLVLVLEVRRVDEDQLVVGDRQLHLLGVGGDLVARDAIEADLADAEHGRPIEELRDAREHVAGELAVVGLLRVDRQPGVVLHAVLRGAARLELRELPEVVLDAVAAAAVPAGPERRFGDRDAAGQRHLLVVVGRARDHVRVVVDVFHERPSWFQRSYAPSALFRSSASSGPVLGSLSRS